MRKISRSESKKRRGHLPRSEFVFFHVNQPVRNTKGEDTERIDAKGKQDTGIDAETKTKGKIGKHVTLWRANVFEACSVWPKGRAVGPIAENKREKTRPTA